jgi:hypothetical protein
VNKAIFEENWKMIRSLLTAKWSLMVEYDLVKVDKAEVKFDKFVTMLKSNMGTPVRKPETKLACSGQNTKPTTKLNRKHKEQYNWTQLQSRPKPNALPKGWLNTTVW